MCLGHGRFCAGNYHGYLWHARTLCGREEGSVKTLVLPFPTFGFIVATRVALAAGVGLILSRQLTDRQRLTIGSTLIGVGAITTIPALLSVVRGTRRSREQEQRLTSNVRRDEGLRGATRYPRTADDEFVSA
jgi:hypothetical protein